MNNSLPFDEWIKLPGVLAEVWRNGKLLGTGSVDAVTPDSSIAWLVSDPIGARVLLEKANGIELRISQEQFIRRIDRSSRSASCG